jgi:AcrR family transcriptional regulator
MAAGDDTKTRILDAAEQLFADHGYAATTVREVSSQAEVNLAAINYHFGGKEALFVAVVERRLEPLNSERLRRLAAAVAPRPRPTVESLVEGFFGPTYELALEGRQGRSWVKLVSRYRIEPGSHWDAIEAEYAQVTAVYRDAFVRALPQVPAHEVHYRLFFLTGALLNSLADANGLELIDDSLATVGEDPEGVFVRIVEFVSAGMRAPIGERE